MDTFGLAWRTDDPHILLPLGCLYVFPFRSNWNVLRPFGPVLVGVYPSPGSGPLGIKVT